MANVQADDPLASLISQDGKAVDRRILADLLHGLVEIDGASKEFYFLPEFVQLKSNERKVELLLAAAKARSLVFELPDGLAPKDVISLEIMPEGSVKTCLKRLFDAHKIKKDKDGRYYLPNFQIANLASHGS